MKLLLDTHAVLWWFADDPALPHRAEALIDDGSAEQRNRRFVTLSAFAQTSPRPPRGIGAAIRVMPLAQSAGAA